MNTPLGKISSNAPEGSITRKLYATALQKKASEASFQAPIELVIPHSPTH